MKPVLLLCVAATLFSSMSFATIRRVGYFGPAVSGVDYAYFGAAHTAASVGDTIMMMPGSQINGESITKRLIVIGPGYFLAENSGLQANSISMDSIGSRNNRIKPSANGTIFIGCTFGGQNISSISLETGVENITFLRCRFNGFQSTAVVTTEETNNIMFQQCAFAGVAFHLGQKTTNISFFNCLFYGANHYNLYAPSIGCSGLFQNCVFQGQVTNYLDNGVWQMNNCIIQSSSMSGTNVSYQNCIATGTQIPAGNGNQQNKSWESIFTLTGSTDAQYTLKAGSPAIGAGIGGTNCGIFGGTSPYKLSGIPSVPTIYAISSPQGNTPTVNTVQINLSTRSNN